MFIITTENGYTKIVAKGKLLHADYINSLIPSIEKLAKDDKFKIMVVMNDMKGIELKAVIDDLKTYIKNRNKFDRVAIVTNKKWVQVCLGFFRHIMSGEFNTFFNENSAEKWLNK
ncbi:STAS/SEC14 domain-containing protein [Francisella sp. 19X1-34]|uniref:STAS/SEC14 domain-containing protein n=1 Tax=Francisella sp. 19X1-34 TaxID=3087177 RepID=UPI002E36C5BC|nr:STAS/SEC14 domain-containing protein [Francisella sp. 19X1-34]MED7789273.1 STAS/SEC14 domain-containing protein [Francisella sp. 19X1-34]